MSENMDTITVELTLEQARALLRPAEHYNGDLSAQARRRVNDVLVENNRKRRLGEYRLPWADISEMRAGGAVFDGDGRRLATTTRRKQARLIAAAPKLAEAAAALLDHEYPGGEYSSTSAIGRLAAALDESGWPRSGQ